MRVYFKESDQESFNAIFNQINIIFDEIKYIDFSEKEILIVFKASDYLLPYEERLNIHTIKEERYLRIKNDDILLEKALLWNKKRKRDDLLDNLLMNYTQI